MAPSGLKKEIARGVPSPEGSTVRPAAVLALLVQFGFEGLDRLLVPAALRGKSPR